MEQKTKLCDEVETIRKFTYHGDRVNAVRGCEAAVTARTRYWQVELRECGELMYGRFPLKRNGAVYKSYIRPAVPNRSETWCLRENQMKI